jgi:hypothetical protein
MASCMRSLFTLAVYSIIRMISTDSARTEFILKDQSLTVTISEVPNLLVFCLKHDVSGTGVYPRLQVAYTYILVHSLAQ